MASKLMPIPKVRERIQLCRNMGIEVQSVKFDPDGSVTISSAAPDKDNQSFEDFMENAG